ncbi:TlpA family protein disulfide reductase [Sphaerimonospora mesophila]|uniref:TlpA family protein disulfide reductase n=1 Tax=Sphaerimonospora mesophila TaxID=37483 RepID=UPI0006E2E46F
MTSLITVIGVLVTANLALTLMVIKKIRDGEVRFARIEASLPGSRPPAEVMLAPGEQIGEFSVKTIDGELVTEQTPFLLVGVFSATCFICHERIPEFVKLAETLTPGQVLAVLTGDQGSFANELPNLRQVAMVTNEAAHGGPVATALDVKGAPAFGWLDGARTVLASGARTSDLTVVQAARR